MLTHLPGKLRPRRPSHGTVVAYLALFVALGGSAYAVAANSVGTAQLKNGAVTNPKLANESVGSGKVIDGSLDWSDLGGSLRTVVQGRCPLDSGSPMDLIGRGDTLCMDHFARGPTDQGKALIQCAKAGLHLASTDEMWMAGEAGRLVHNIAYWTDFFEKPETDQDFPWARTVGVATASTDEDYVAYGWERVTARHYYVCVGFPMHA